jgi:hypothetical protein
MLIYLCVVRSSKSILSSLKRYIPHKLLLYGFGLVSYKVLVLQPMLLRGIELESCKGSFGTEEKTNDFSRIQFIYSQNSYGSFGTNECFLIINSFLKFLWMGPFCIRSYKFVFNTYNFFFFGKKHLPLCYLSILFFMEATGGTKSPHLIY